MCIIHEIPSPFAMYITVVGCGYELQPGDRSTCIHNLKVLCMFPFIYCMHGTILINSSEYRFLSCYLFSDGAELLLDLGLPAAIVGGVLLPLLGAIPSSAMILFVGVTGSKEEANEQIAIGMRCE